MFPRSAFYSGAEPAVRGSASAAVISGSLARSASGGTQRVERNETGAPVSPASGVRWTRGGLALLGVAALGFASSQSYWMLAAFSVVAGTGNGVFHPVDYTLLNRISGALLVLMGIWGIVFDLLPAL